MLNLKYLSFSLWPIVNILFTLPYTHTHLTSAVLFLMVIDTVFRNLGSLSTKAATMPLLHLQFHTSWLVTDYSYS